jgi:hypothetical protein
MTLLLCLALLHRCLLLLRLLRLREQAQAAQPPHHSPAGAKAECFRVNIANSMQSTTNSIRQSKPTA